jgi:hypothetical protein
VERRDCLVVVEKFLLAVPEFEPLTSQPVAIRNIDCAFKSNGGDVGVKIKHTVFILYFVFIVFLVLYIYIYTHQTNTDQ